jgi:hypothetical protein
MAAWYSKNMQVGELRQFGDAFTREFQKLGEPVSIAAFSRPHSNGMHFTVFATPAAIEIAEQLAPDGWVSTDRPAGELRLLAGRSDAILWFGLRL